ncbi:hypothetical protein [Pseudobacillus wudalianchiensis]|uniref:Uncharacterized protein n=1 Tax=Pseudobacillus wudalianchiensis TaxID=1743143 RepID=A0A1B9B9X0_9BACI|nr:hypothetical protein [Bacillus wudalianchiensis]OCA92872.1 hypothetical protein A8F95_04085 [Bacillus wudalianchiensis]
MFQDFEVEPMFEDQVHERHQFKLNVEGMDYRGLFHEGEIHWFNPHPKQNLGDSHVEAIESQVYDLITDHLEQ